MTAAAVVAAALILSGFARAGLTDARSANAVWLEGGALQVFHRQGAGGPIANGPVRAEFHWRPGGLRLEFPGWWVNEVKARVLADPRPGGAQTIRIRRASVPLWMPLVLACGMWVKRARGRARSTGIGSGEHAADAALSHLSRGGEQPA